MKCPYCFNNHTVKNGKKISGNQNYKCIDCNKQFVETNGTIFYRKHKDAKQTLIPSGLLNIKGCLSFRLVEQFIEFLFGKRRSYTTYYYRHKSLDGKLEELMKQYKPNYSKVWHIDELFHKCKKNPTKFRYLFAVCDDKSNILALYPSNNRDTESAKKTLMLARKEAGFNPEIVVHDGCPIYEACKTIFGRRVKFVQSHFKAEPFLYVNENIRELYYLSNNRLEGLNSWIRQWLHHFRGFKSYNNAVIWCFMFMALWNLLHTLRINELAIALLK